MRRIRPSLRKLKKAERLAGDLYAANAAAQARVVGRIRDALDRISVASQFDEFSGAVPAQLGHARSFIRSGGPGELETLYSPQVSDEVAAELVVTLSHMFHDALVAELLERASDREVQRSRGASGDHPRPDEDGAL
ncbi:MAG: hypothetical protein U0838_12935 [Chloroflexota bacterium]